MDDLKTLKDRPFELLSELERRARAVAVGGDHTGDPVAFESGVAFRVGPLQLVAMREDIREILARPSVARVPGTQPWVAGLANVRGQLLPVTDLAGFFLGATAVAGRGTRVLAVNHPQVSAGLLVDEVLGFRRWSSVAASFDDGVIEAVRRFASGTVCDDGERYVLIDLKRIVESRRFLQAAG